MEVKCPHCNKRLSLGNEFAGQTVLCQVCNNLFFAEPPDDLPKPCPNCDNVVTRADKICLNCGYNFDTLMVMERQHAPDETYHPWWFKALSFIAECLPGLFRPAPLIGFIVCMVLALGIEWLALFICLMGAVLSAFMVAVAGMMVYIHGVAFLAVGSIIDLRNAMVELHGRSMEAFVWLSAAPVLLLLAAMFLLGKMMNTH
jgi:hypothetical protein